MKGLNLGCGTAPLPSVNDEIWTNHDLTQHHDYVDIACDLNLPNKADEWYFFEDQEFDQVVAQDVLEHLDHPVRALEECWRILKPGGILMIRVPNGVNHNYQTDLTHTHPFTWQSLDYFVRGKPFEQKYGFYSRMRWAVIDFHIDESDNLNWTLRKDEPA